MGTKLTNCDAKLRARIEAALREQDKTNSAGNNPKLECAPIHAPLEKDKGQEGAAGKLHIRFTSVRKRLCDPDNLSVKWLLDCLRYCGAITGDEPEKISLEVGQRKCQKEITPYTLIEIERIL